MFLMLRWTFALFMLTIALILSWLRFGVTLSDVSEQGSILEHVLPHLGVEFQAKQVRISWRQFGLSIQAQNLILVTPRYLLQEASLETLYIHVHLLRSLYAGHWVIDELTLSQGEVVFRESAKKSTPEMRSKSTWLDDIYQNIQSVRWIDLQKIRVAMVLDERNAPKLWLERFKVNIERDKYQIHAKLNPSGEPSQDDITIRSTYVRENPVVGELFVEAKNVDFTDWLNMLTHDVPIASSSINLKASAVFSRHQAPIGHIEFGETYLNVGVHHPRQAYGLHRGQVFLRPNESGWELLGYQLDIFHNGNTHHDWLLEVTRSKEDLEGVIGPIRLELLRSFQDVLELIYPETAHALQALSPRGYVENTHFRFNLQDSTYQVKGQIRDFGTSQWYSVPAIDQALMIYSFTHNGGHCDIAQDDGQLDFGDYFKHPWSVERLRAQLAWRYAKDMQPTLIELKGLELKTPQLQLDSEAQLLFHQLDNPHLRLYSEISLNDVRHAQDYFPLRAMHTHLVDYLSHGLQAGFIEQGQVLWDGRIKDFPYPKQQGVFMADATVQQAQFQFAPHWRPLTDMALNLLFHNKRLDLLSHHAHLDEVQVTQIKGTIPTLGKPESRLTLDAQIQGDGQAATHYLLNSPLRNNLEKTLTHLSISGPVDAQLALDIPLDNPKSGIEIQSQVSFLGNDVALPTQAVSFSAMKGVLVLDNKHSRIEHMQGLINGMPVTLSYNGSTNDEKEFHAAIEFQGYSAVEHWEGSSLARALRLKGESGWHGLLDIQVANNHQFLYQFALDSDLLGLESKLPDPFRKKPEQDKYLHVRVYGNEFDSRASVYFDQWLSLDADIKHTQKHQYVVDSIFLDAGNPHRSYRWPSNDAGHFKLQQLDLSDWINVSQDIRRSFAEYPSLKDNTSAITWPQTMELIGEIDDIALDAHHFKDAQLEIHLDPKMTTVDFQTQRFKGKVASPREQSAPLNIQLVQVDWAGFVQQKKQGKAVNIDFQQLLNLPWIRFSCESFRFSDKITGGLNFEIQVNSDAKKIDIINMTFTQEDLNLEGGATWQQKGGTINGQALLSGHLNNIQRFIEDIGYHSPISQSSFDWKSQFSWHDKQLLPNLENLQGQFQAHASKGMLVDIDEAGAKILSLIDLNSLVRRLRLDFSDVFGKGFFFNQISLTGTLTDGVVKNEDFLVNGSSGRISGHGQIDLPKNTIGYYLTFTPNLSGSLPLVTAFAWNPLVAIPIFAASKLLEPVIDVVTRIDYKVTGRILDPKLEEIRRRKGKVELQEENTPPPKPDK